MNGSIDLFFISILQTGLCVAKPVVPGCVGENPDQASPISVLEAPLEEDDNTTRESSVILKQNLLGISLNL